MRLTRAVAPAVEPVAYRKIPMNGKVVLSSMMEVISLGMLKRRASNIANPIVPFNAVEAFMARGMVLGAL